LEAARGLDADLLFLAGARSLAETWTMPFASMSKVTSICGTPRGAGGDAFEVELAEGAVVAAISRSPWSTWMVTAVWLSAAVEKTWRFLDGDGGVAFDELGA
jgi:hypothetical protein